MTLIPTIIEQSARSDRAYDLISVSYTHLFRQDISAKLNRLPLRYYDAHKTGEIMSRVTNDLEKVSAIMQEGLPQMIASLFTILFAVLVLSLIHIFA